MNKDFIMEEIHQLAIELSQTSDKKKIIDLINEINSLKYKLMSTIQEKYIYNQLDLVGRYGT